MSTTVPVSGRNQSSLDDIEGLDVNWLLHSKRDFPAHTKDNARSKQDASAGAPLSSKKNDATSVQTTPVAAPTQPQVTPLRTSSELPKTNQTNAPTGRSPAGGPPSSPAPQKVVTKGPNADDGKSAGRSPVGTLKKEGRRTSWISSLGHKLSGGSTPSRNSSMDSSKSKSPMNSPVVEQANPFDRKSGHKMENKKEQDTEPPVYVPQSPRRPSVLVAAGTETKTETPGFLTSALRRLSSGTAVTLGKGAGQGAMCARKVMNIDQNRERAKIAEFEQNKLKRVAFCVDVEIAGVASQADEEYTVLTDAVAHHPPTSNMNQTIEESAGKDTKSAKYKDKGEGAALKNPSSASQEKDQIGKTKADMVSEANEKKDSDSGSGATDSAGSKAGDQPAVPTTRKKEKKKRSEAERKERKERKRKHAEANGLVPLELTRDDSDSDSSPSHTPAGVSTPKTNADQPTTDPLRIYKRCCQLRETTPLNTVKDQISKPSATLAEALGTVAVLDLSNSTMTLQDITTLGDWLAVVPVRKLILDNCNLGDEALRIILSGLSSCKTQEQARSNRKLPRNGTGRHGQERMGVIEKLSLKNNSTITSIGWKHIALFMHLSRALVAIDLSGIPFANPSARSGNTGAEGAGGSSNKLNSLVARAISDRYGDRLEELILSGCGLSADHVADFVNAAIKCRIRRLGLAGNDLGHDSLEHIVRYVQSGICEGLDLGSNNLHGAGRALADVLDKNNPLFALSLADCELTPDDLNDMLPRFTVLQNFKFIDLSRNRALFSEESTAVPIFRKVLPKMRTLKRIHLADVGMTPYHVIALSEIFPDCTSLAHVNILENESLVSAMNSKSAELQEEAAAFLASMMTAVRVSHTIVAIEVEVPSSDTSEVVRALSSQIVAYSLRNMERSALNEYGVQSSHSPDKDAPDVLLHLVGHMDGYEGHDNDEPAPDDDYLIASTGIAKALRVCLGNKDGSRFSSRNITPTASGTATPKHAGSLRPSPQKKPRDVSFELCESARKIRMRLRPALIKEDRAGNTEGYRRLAALDGTLQRIIQRFEDEYPEAKPRSDHSSPYASGSPPDMNSPMDSPDISRVNSRLESSTRPVEDTEPQDQYALRLSRTSSNTSLARALTHEEGRMHRFGQSIRRQVLAPTGTDDYEHGTSVYDRPEPDYLAALRSKLEQLQGEDIRHRVNKYGADEVIREIGVNAEELKALKFEDPEGFEAFKNSHLAAQVNQGLIDEAERQKSVTSVGSDATANNAGKENTKGFSLYSQVTG